MTNLYNGIEDKIDTIENKIYSITDRFINARSYITTNIYKANWVYKGIKLSFYSERIYIIKLRAYGLNNIYTSPVLYLPFKFNNVNIRLKEDDDS